MTVTQIQGENVQRTIKIDQVQQSMNDMKLDQKETKSDVKDVRERVIRLEEDNAKR